MNVLHIHSCICSFWAIKNLYAPMKCNRNRTSFETFFLFVHAVSGEDMIRIENGDHDERGESRGKTAVIKHEAAVHTCGGGAYDCVDQAGKQALFPTVSSRNGAETRGERNTVDVYLRRKHPRKRFTEKGIDDTNEKRQGNVAEYDGSNVSRVLSVCGKRQSRKQCADRRTREACADGKSDLGENHTEKLGCKKDNIQISKCTESVKTEVDKADGHTEFGRKVKSVTCAFEQSAVSVEGFSVHDKAQHDGGEEYEEEKDVHEYDVGIIEGIVDGIVTNDNVRRGKTEGSIQKRMRANTENAYGESRLIHIVSSLDGCDTGKESGHDKARQRTENDCKDHAEQAELDRTEMKLTDGIAEQKVADERSERGGEHGDMQIFANGCFSDPTVDQNADEGRPHIQKVESVKAMRDDKNIRSEGFCVGLGFGDEDHQIAGKSAQTCVEQRTRQTTQIKVVRYQFGR